MCGCTVDIQSAMAEIRRGKKERTRMWANAQRDGRPAEHRWRPLWAEVHHIMRTSGGDIAA